LDDVENFDKAAIQNIEIFDETTAKNTAHFAKTQL
jgi:hypothetical protein